jgi:hypothetical protein
VKRTVPLLITFLVGLLLLAAPFVPPISVMRDVAAVHFDVLAAIAFILGGGNLLRSHGEKIYKRQSGWAYSLIAVVSFLLMFSLGLFKIGVHGRPGHWSWIEGGGNVAGLVTIDQRDESFEMDLKISGVDPGTYPVEVDGTRVGEVEVDPTGRGEVKVGYDPSEVASDDPRAVLAKVGSGSAVAVGDVAQVNVQRYSRVTGDYLDNGSGFWYLFTYAFVPLQQTTFAMLAFYVASAAFRAFRARNVESVLLLGTAFVILLGRTFVGTWMTGWLPDEGFSSFFQVPNLVIWIMKVMNTAGQRAIMIGIALGIASTSLKVLLGIDRSYLGSERE